MKMGKNSFLTVTVGLMAVLSLAGVAWACTGQPQVMALSLDRAPAGSEVSVTGQRVPTDYVEVRWDSLTGQVIGAGRATNGDFSVTVRIPEQASQGIYYMVVSATPLGYSQGTPTVTRVSFEVTPSPADTGGPAAAETASRNVSEDLWSAFDSASSGFDVATGPGAAETTAQIPGLGIGLGMLIFGGLTLVGTAATAAGKNRRAVSKTSNREY